MRAMEPQRFSPVSGACSARRRWTLQPARGPQMQRQRGSILATLIILTMVLIALGITLTDVAIHELSSSVESGQEEQALVAADGAIDYACWQLQNSQGNLFWLPNGYTFTGRFAATNTPYQVTITPDVS